MPEPRAKIIVRPAHAGGLQNFRSMVLAELANYPNWQAYVDASDVDQIGPFRVTELIFEQVTHAQLFRQWVINNLAAIRVEVNGIIKGYLCSHNDPVVYSCHDDPRSQYQEVLL